jgi:hypothetical protein
VTAIAAKAAPENPSPPTQTTPPTLDMNGTAAEKSPKKKDNTRKSARNANPLSQPAAREAAAVIQTILAAIERTHGYLSKTILTQFFAGTASKGVSGLRLQRLPEFGLLKDWKKSHASGLIEIMLEQHVIQQTEIRLGKMTVSITELGTQCCQSAEPIPLTLLEFVAHAIASVHSDPDPSPNVANATIGDVTPQTPEMSRTKQPRGDQPPRIELPPRIEQPPSNEQYQGDENPVRPASELPSVSLGDAIGVSSPRAMLEDWQWTLRLVQHGYRLGECALIRRQNPDFILKDLLVALENHESFAIDHLFDRRTVLAIEELRRSGSIPNAPPPVFQVFPSLWPLVHRWMDSKRGSYRNSNS